MKEYPDWTVEPCICTTGNLNSACPYQQSTDEDFMIKGIYSRYAAEDSAENTTRLNGDFT